MAKDFNTPAFGAFQSISALVRRDGHQIPTFVKLLAKRLRERAGATCGPQEVNVSGVASLFENDPNDRTDKISQNFLYTRSRKEFWGKTSVWVISVINGGPVMTPPWTTLCAPLFSQWKR